MVAGACGEKANQKYTHYSLTENGLQPWSYICEWKDTHFLPLLVEVPPYATDYTMKCYTNEEED